MFFSFLLMQDASSGKKPSETISTCGYTLERYPNSYFRKVMEAMVTGMGLGPGEITITFSPWAWALTHPVRQNYVFQLHPGKDVSGAFTIVSACPLEIRWYSELSNCIWHAYIAQHRHVIYCWEALVPSLQWTKWSEFRGRWSVLLLIRRVLEGVLVSWTWSTWQCCCLFLHKL